MKTMLHYLVCGPVCAIGILATNIFSVHSVNALSCEEICYRTNHDCKRLWVGVARYNPKCTPEGRKCLGECLRNSQQNRQKAHSHD